MVALDRGGINEVRPPLFFNQQLIIYLYIGNNYFLYYFIIDTVNKKYGRRHTSSDSRKYEEMRGGYERLLNLRTLTGNAFRIL